MDDLLSMPWTQGFSYDEMPEGLQDEVDERAEVYSSQTFENGTVDNEDVVLFYVGENTLVEKAKDSVEYTDDDHAVVQGNLTAAAVERVAEDVLEATDAETAVIWDNTEGTPVYQKEVNPDDSLADRASPLDIVKEIGNHYEDIEARERVEANQEQLKSVLSSADPHVRQTVINARQEAYKSLQKYKQDDEVEHPEALAYRDMNAFIDDSDVGNERVGEALDAIKVSTDPVFAKTMSSGYFLNRMEQKRENRR